MQDGFNEKLKEFVMGMGTYFFTFTDGSTAYEYKCESLDNFISKWDKYLKITGEPMRFTKKSRVIEDW